MPVTPTAVPSFRAPVHGADEHWDLCFGKPQGTLLSLTALWPCEVEATGRRAWGAECIDVGLPVTSSF